MVSARAHNDGHCEDIRTLFAQFTVTRCTRALTGALPAGRRRAKSFCGTCHDTKMFRNCWPVLYPKTTQGGHSLARTMHPAVVDRVEDLDATKSDDDAELLGATEPKTAPSKERSAEELRRER